RPDFGFGISFGWTLIAARWEERGHFLKVLDDEIAILLDRRSVIGGFSLEYLEELLARFSILFHQCLALLDRTGERGGDTDACDDDSNRDRFNEFTRAGHAYPPL